ncbi:MAG: IclR family transcriptional regulator [Anaerolineales bacterium]|nr:IclR family transcriptional regulator [Anaerolineales bacterium]
MEEKQNEPSTITSQTVLKSLDVLDCLGAARRSLSAPEIAKLCQMSRPTTYRLLTTLMSRGYVMVDENYNYSLGTKILGLARVVLDTMNLPKLAQPYLHELSQLSQETAFMSILDDTKILYIAKEEGPQVQASQTFQMRSNVGTRIDLHMSAMGKAILSNLPDEERRALLERLPLPRYTNHTITDHDALMNELEQTRHRGYAIDDCEGDDWIRCVAAPVYDGGGQVLGAISIAGPAHRMTLEHVHQLSPDVIRVTQALSKQLGRVTDSVPQ